MPVVMTVEQIQAILPHRFPFLLVDRVIELTDEKIVALKNVTVNEPFFQGHFPGAPVMPGVLQVEAMAQAGGLLGARLVEFHPTTHVMLFMAIDQVKFRKPVVPGDQVEIKVRKTKQRGNIWRFACEALVDGGKVAEADISAMMSFKPTA